MERKNFHYSNNVNNYNNIINRPKHYSIFKEKKIILIIFIINIINLNELIFIFIKIKLILL